MEFAKQTTCFLPLVAFAKNDYSELGKTLKAFPDFFLYIINTVYLKIKIQILVSTEVIDNQVVIFLTELSLLVDCPIFT